VFALMLGAFALGSEYGWDTLRPLLTQCPDRQSVVAAKLAAPDRPRPIRTGPVRRRRRHQLRDRPDRGRARELAVRLAPRPCDHSGLAILAVLAALGVLLGVATRGTSLAIGVGLLYALVIEGLLNAFADSVSVLEPLTNVFLRADGYSIAAALGASVDSIESSGPGSFSGPFVGSGQALGVLVAFTAGFIALSAFLLRRRDIAP
jgi:ABC-2 type transport system permease protein